MIAIKRNLSSILPYFIPRNNMGIVDLKIQVPSWNAAYRINGHSMYKTAEAKAFQEAIGYSYKGDMHTGNVEVFIEFARKPLIDVDNMAKLFLDSLEGIAYKKDRQVRILTIERHECERGEDWLWVSVNDCDGE